MSYKNCLLIGAAAATTCLAIPVAAQDAGEVNVRVSGARTKLVDEGTIFSDGVEDPNGAYETREAYHSVVTLSYFPIDGFAIDASVSTPLTTNNIPAGSLAGLPNLGDDEFIMATIGASVHPIDGPIRPYVGGGLAYQLTTQERDGLAVGLNIPNAHGPYVNAGANVSLTPRLDAFVDVRKAWYSTGASGLLPLDATFTTFAQVDADAELDPLTIQLGLGVRFGGNVADPAPPIPAREAGDLVVKLGITNLELADELDLSVGGAPFPNAGLSTFEHQTISAQFGYFVTDHVAVNATVGFPPTIDIYGAGSIGPLPQLGEVTYGPSALTVQFHPVTTGRVRPYVGAGLSYMFVFGTEDGAFEDLEVTEDLGWAFEAGVDMLVNDQVGVFLDLKKTLLRPTAMGTFQGMEVVGESRLDPWAISTGVSLSF
ncbi:OmpW/AlkL family protein [Erythrobacter alti]|uniref:OmpW/AlkL family protein n=1 Tax=Erythrobacter alti TaxID=1896145 RepID=UPI0030F3D57E